MSVRYLEVTFRNGRALAAYLYLPRRSGDVSARTAEIGSGLIADFSADGRCIGVEMLRPQSVTASMLNEALRAYLVDPIGGDELAPLAA